jgi:CHAT domain-containing protein
MKLEVKMLEEALLDLVITDEHLIEHFHKNEFRYGVVHFACHCSDGANAGASQSYLSLTAHEADLDIYLERLIACEEYGFVNRPFVFLNACGSATVEHLSQSMSLPAGMLKFGARGVIATACTISDDFASAFANEFYKRLLQKLLIERIANIGETLLETRLHFLTNYANPLGLAYGLYAASNQQLSLDDDLTS